MRGWIIAALVASTTPVAAQAVADRSENRARGTRSCEIVQWHSAERTQHYGSRADSIAKFVVSRDGAVSLRFRRTLYPGSPVFMRIAGQRRSWNEASARRLDRHFLSALQRDEPFDVSYQVWPYRRDIAHTDRFQGFAAAYQTCLTHLRGT